MLRTVPLVLVGSLLYASLAEAQALPRPSVELLTGHAGYVDEVWDNRVMLGGNVRVGLTPKLSIGPEVVYQDGSDGDYEWLVTGTANFDLMRPSRRRVVPFLVAAAGLVRYTTLVGRGPGTVGLASYTSSDFTASGGIGVRVAIARGFYVATDARLGWQPERRITAALGWRPN